MFNRAGKGRKEPIASLEEQSAEILAAVRELKECYRLVMLMLEMERGRGPELPDDLEVEDPT